MREGRILEDGITNPSIFITFNQQENDLLSGEVLLSKTCFSSVNVIDHITFLKSPFERLEHYSPDAPVFVTTNTAGYFGLLEANVSDDRNGLVIAPKITKRRPILVVLSKQTGWQNEQNNEGFE